MKKKPNLSFWQIWNMSFGFLGIQFGFALQNANVSRIFETLGAKVDSIPILWIAAPVTGLLIQPIIGHFSDNTWGRLGRRRPYFLAGAILASLGLIIMPNSPVLWIAAGTLWMMDASINVSMEPFRAYVGDMLPSEQRTAGFAMQSFFIGVGAVVASALPYMLTNWFGVANVATEGKVPPSVEWSFYIGGLIYILAVVWTVVSSKEYSPQQLREFDGENTHVDPETKLSKTEMVLATKRATKVGLPLLIIGALSAAILAYIEVEKEVYILAVGMILFGLIELVVSLMQKNQKSNGLTSIINDFNTMPKTMQQLALVQFFSWFALFAMWIYTTSGVTSHIYHTTDPASAAYNEGANWVGVCFSVYNGMAAVFAFFLMWLAKKTSRKQTHAFALMVGAVSFLSIYFISNPTLLLVPFIGVGLTWASILAMPYAILTGSLPSNKMGVFMGIFNFFIVIPQILAASILGFLIRKVFANEPIWALVLGGVSWIIAALMVLVVKDDDKN